MRSLPSLAEGCPREAVRDHRFGPPGRFFEDTESDQPTTASGVEAGFKY